MGRVYLTAVIGLVVFACVTARASAQTVAQPRTNAGIHKGVVTFAPNGVGDPHKRICQIQLSYGLWTLLEEPVEDYLFKWDACPDTDATLSGRTFADVKLANPEYSDRLDQLTPLDVVLRGTVSFYSTAVGGTPFATGTLDINPDLISPSGKPAAFSVPGSPEWDKWFVDFKWVGDGKKQVPTTTENVSGGRGERCSALCPNAEAVVGAKCGGSVEVAACNCNESASPPFATIEYRCSSSVGLRGALAAAQRVEIQDLKLHSVTWPNLDDIILSADRKSAQALAQTQSFDEFWGQAPPQPRSNAVDRSTAAAGVNQRLAAARREREKEAQKFARNSQPSVQDMSFGQQYAIRLSGDIVQVAQNGTTVSEKNGVYTLSSGTQHLRVDVQGGSWEVTATCGEVDVQKGSCGPSNGEREPGKKYLNLCFETREPRCSLSEWRFVR